MAFCVIPIEIVQAGVEELVQQWSTNSAIRLDVLKAQCLFLARTADALFVFFQRHLWRIMYPLHSVGILIFRKGSTKKDYGALRVGGQQQCQVNCCLGSILVRGYVKDCIHFQVLQSRCGCFVCVQQRTWHSALGLYYLNDQEYLQLLDIMGISWSWVGKHFTWIWWF